MGWLIGPRSLVDAARDLKDYTTHTVCSLNDKLAELTLRKWRDLMPRYREWVLTNTERFARFVDEHPEHIEWVRPEGGMVCFPRLKSPRPTTEIARELVQQKQVFILPGETFDMPHHARVGFGLEPSDFDEAMNRWSAFLNGR